MNFDNHIVAMYHPLPDPLIGALEGVARHHGTLRIREWGPLLSSISLTDPFKIFRENLTCTTLRARTKKILHHRKRSDYGPLFGQHVPKTRGKKPLINNPNNGGVLP